ncbi:DNA polymerase III subunit delta [Lusitaniella coriacea]|uniref:DNA polymerase III subunit delta n=1 Tax=Lusitaniella coriacea TaxID=1983105 RepID=UPI003CEAFB3A
MPVYIDWGDDEYLISRHLDRLKTEVLHPAFAALNFSQYPPDANVSQALSDAIAPPLGEGGRLVFLPESRLLGALDDGLLVALEQTINALPPTTTLVLTSTKKPDGRLKSVKLLKQHAIAREFSRIPLWKTAELVRRVREMASVLDVSLSAEAAECLAAATGNDAQRLFNELEKLSTYANGRGVEAEDVRAMVANAATTPFQLAGAIGAGNAAEAIALFDDLQANSESAVKIVATLVAQFRTWLWVKALAGDGETNNRAIALQAGIDNPNRIYYLRQEVAALSLPRLQRTMRQLLALELTVKTGGDLSSIHSHLIQLCLL